MPVDFRRHVVRSPHQTAMKRRRPTPQDRQDRLNGPEPERTGNQVDANRQTEADNTDHSHRADSGARRHDGRDYVHIGADTGTLAPQATTPENWTSPGTRTPTSRPTTGLNGPLMTRTLRPSLTTTGTPSQLGPRTQSPGSPRAVSTRRWSGPSTTARGPIGATWLRSTPPSTHRNRHPNQPSRRHRNQQPRRRRSPPPDRTTLGRGLGQQTWGDIADTELTNLQVTVNDDDPINYFKFNLSAARKVGVRILRLDFNADLYIEDNSGTVIHSSENAGDNKEVLNIQLAATGEVYYIRVEGKEAGENDYTLRYLTEEIPVPEPVPEPALQSQSQQSTTTRGVGDATGKPTISGPPQVGETLEADTSAIDDTDGINNVAFTYQWIRVDSSDVETNITTAVASTYLVTADDLDNTIKVKVSFTDDAGNSEALTSDAYPAVGTVAAAKTECPTDHDWCTTMTSGRIVTPLATGSFAQFGYISPSFGVLDDDAPSDPHRDTDYTVTKIFIAKNSDSGGTVVAHSLSFFVSDGTLPDGTALNLNGTEFSVGHGYRDLGRRTGNLGFKRQSLVRLGQGPVCAGVPHVPVRSGADRLDPQRRDAKADVHRSHDDLHSIGGEQRDSDHGDRDAARQRCGY